MDVDEKKFFRYQDDLDLEYQNAKPSIVETATQNFSPKRLGAMLMIEFQRLVNTHVNTEHLAKKYGLKYDKIVCFRYNDLKLKPFFFSCNAGQVLLVNGMTNYHTMITTDLQTIMNVLKGKISLSQARRDGRIIMEGDRVGYDDVLFFEIFNQVAPHLRKKLNIGK